MKKGINKFLKISVGAGGKIFMNPEDLIKGVTSQENIIIIDPEKDVLEEKYELSYADFTSIISITLYVLYIILHLAEMIIITKFQLVSFHAYSLLFFLISIVILLICLIIHISIYIGRKRMER